MAATAHVDITADLQNEDESGYVWTYLDRAKDPARISPGRIVIAGSSEGRCLARVVDLKDGPDGCIVHLELSPESVSEFESTNRQHA